MKTTYIVVKPSARLMGAAFVFEMLQKLRIDQTSRNTKAQAWISSEQIRILYFGSPEPILKRTVEEMLGCLSVIRFTTFLESADIVGRIASIRGSNVNPALCEPGTIRRGVFDIVGCTPVQLEGGYTYYPNFIHIPQDVEEARICEQIFGTHFK